MFTTIPQPRLDAEEPPPTLGDEHGASALPTIKRLIWLYFWLLILEGALRKWILPGWSNPILLIRDPVVIAIYLFAGSAGIFPQNRFIFWTTGLTLVSFIGSELGGEGNLLVSLFGVRTNFLHLPLIFLLPNVFDRKDMDAMAKWFFISSIPMGLLVLAQFEASPDSWINNGAGGSENGQLESAYGKIRPPGTFSFTTGLTCYLSVAIAFAIQTLMQQNSKNLKLAMIALPAIGIMVVISGSRAALGSVILVIIAAGVVCLKKPAFFGRSAKLVLVFGLAYFALGFWSEFQQGIDVHRWRVEGGGGVKEGILMRFFGDLFPIDSIINAPFLGAGLGMGTNAASSFLYGHRTFSLGESDWQRIIGESGAVIGLAFIGFRIAILIHLGFRSFDCLRQNDPLPLLLYGASFPQILIGQLGVPTTQGWAIFSGALCLASTYALSATASEAGPVAELVVAQAPSRNPRGRSVYADQLHGEFEDPDIARFGP